MLDKFTIKEILAFVLIIQGIGLYGLFIIFKIQTLCLKDHASIYNKIKGTNDDD